VDEHIEEKFLDTPDTLSSDDLDASVPFNPGSIILDKYLVLNLLGRGGMGSVFRVRDLQLRREYALKCLNKHLTNDVVWRRFDNEARAANRFDHPNLIKVYDSGLLPDGQPYFVMDLVDGFTLADDLKVKGRLSLEESLKIMIQVVFAIAYAHENGVIHRDIKPSNIMLGKDGQTKSATVKLVDFGIAKLTGMDEFNQMTLTRTGEIFGSPLYMSPEQCAGRGADHRSDLYSFGCVMYEMLTGAPPILADNALSTMVKHQSERPVSLKQASLGLEFPNSIELVIATLLEKDPALRYQDADLLAKDLIRIETQVSSGAKPESVPSFELAALKEKSALPKAPSKPQAPYVILIVLIAYLLGLMTGLILNKNNLDARKQAELPAELPGQLSKADTFADHAGELDKVINEDSATNLTAPFSTLIHGSRSRFFHFPDRESLGDVKLGLVTHRAQHVITLDNFEPVSFIAYDYAFDHPEQFSRFRDDELGEVELADCDTNLENILQRLKPMKKLYSLKLVGSSLNDQELPTLDSLTGLVNLDVGKTKITGGALSKLKILPNLRKLNCAAISDIRPLSAVLYNCNKLDDLDFTNMSLDRSSLVNIARIPKLTHLTIGNSKRIDDRALTALAGMNSLSHLEVINCPLTSASIETFRKLPHLTELIISREGWTDAQLTELQLAVGRKCPVQLHKPPRAKFEQ
jgi:serine/threonine protein kinase